MPDDVPQSLKQRFERAGTLASRGHLDDAIVTLAEGARLFPGNPQLAAQFGRLLSNHHRHAEALDVLRAGVRAAPADLPLRGLLAAELAGAMNFTEALGQLRLFAVLAPGESEIETNIGVLNQSLGRWERAITHYRRAIATDPNNGLAHLNLATALLVRGDFRNGFAEFEWRTTLPSVRRRPVDLPPWRGEPLAGRRLLLTAEQGLGDMIQFARFIPNLASLGGTVLLECPPPLVRLLTGLPGLDRCCPMDEPLPVADITASLLSLPHLLDLEDAGRARYLTAPPPVDESPLPSVGLIWSGKPATGEVFVRRSLNRRACQATDLAPLLDVAGIRLFSLQLDQPAAPFVDLTQGIADFRDTAQRMAGLDLVIAVDTAGAHLAGALGVPLWVLLAPGQADYRWGVGALSPWYPDARLYRADHRGWPPLVRALADDLVNWAATCTRRRADRVPSPGR
jgi:Flp pilus assembly protein TadD